MGVTCRAIRLGGQARRNATAERYPDRSGWIIWKMGFFVLLTTASENYNLADIIGEEQGKGTVKPSKIDGKRDDAMCCAQNAGETFRGRQSMAR